jgi:SAM-dependent methyltransferase
MQLQMIDIGLNNEKNRRTWLAARLAALPKGIRILDAGAGELANRPLCAHLDYVSQDFGQYDGKGDGAGMQVGRWDTSKIDIVCDVVAIPEPDASFEAILCSEVLEHVPDPLLAVKEFSRLLKPGGILILTAPFCSLTHFAPYHFSTGFSSYWYDHHLKANGFEILEMTPNGNWFHCLAQELWRLPKMAGTYSWRPGGWLALVFAVPVLLMLAILAGRRDRGSSELLAYGWHVLARRRAASSGATRADASHQSN